MLGLRLLSLGSLTIVAVVALLLTPAALVKVSATPLRLRQGLYVQYGGNVTMRQDQSEQPYTGSMNWTVTSVAEGRVRIMEKALRDQDSLERTFIVKESSREVLEIDGQPVENQKTFFWVETSIQSGSIVQVENFTFTVVGEETVTIGNLPRPCWLLNGTFNTGSVEGFMTRWYDRETGLLLRFLMIVAFHRDTALLEGGVSLVATETNAWETGGDATALSVAELGASYMAAGGLLASLVSLARRKAS